jgi:hypothetical protein
LMSDLMTHPCTFFFVLHGTVSASIWFLVTVLVPHVLFQGVNSREVRVANFTPMTFHSLTVFAIDVIQQMTTFSEFHPTFLTAVLLFCGALDFLINGIKIVFLGQPHTYLLLTYLLLIFVGIWQYCRYTMHDRRHRSGCSRCIRQSFSRLDR